MYSAAVDSAREERDVVEICAMMNSAHDVHIGGIGITRELAECRIRP